VVASGGISTLEDIFGSSDDAEIDQAMAALKWNEAQKTMARTNYKGRRSELLDHVRAKLKESESATGKAPTPIKKDTPRPSDAKEAETAKKTETTGTTAEASTSAPASVGTKSAAAPISKEAW